MNVKTVRLMLYGTEFSTQILFVNPEPELVGISSIVPYPIVNVVVRDAGTCPERNLPAKVRKKVYSIVVMMLRDCQFAV